MSDSRRRRSSGSARRRGGGRALASTHCAKYRPTVPRAATKSDTRTNHCTSPSHEPMLTAHSRRWRPDFPQQPRPRGARSRSVATQDIRWDSGTRGPGPERPRPRGGQICAPNRGLRAWERNAGQRQLLPTRGWEVQGKAFPPSSPPGASRPRPAVTAGGWAWGGAGVESPFTAPPLKGPEDPHLFGGLFHYNPEWWQSGDLVGAPRLAYSTPKVTDWHPGWLSTGAPG